MVNLDYLYNPEGAKKFFNKNYFLDKKLGFQVIENGTILPYKHFIDGKTTADWWGYGGIIDGNGEYIKNSHVLYGAGGIYYPPPNQFNAVLKPSFISECFTPLGGM